MTHKFMKYSILGHQLIGIMVRVFTNDPGDWGSIASRVIPKTQKIVLVASLLNSQNHKIQIKGKWNNREKEVALFTIRRSNEKGTFGSPSTTVDQLYIYIYIYIYSTVKWRL